MPESMWYSWYSDSPSNEFTFIKTGKEESMLIDKRKSKFIVRFYFKGLIRKNRSRIFETKGEALEFAKNYMRMH